MNQPEINQSKQADQSKQALLSRKEFLKLLKLGMVGGLVSACSPRTINTLIPRITETTVISTGTTEIKQDNRSLTEESTKVSNTPLSTETPFSTKTPVKTVNVTKQPETPPATATKTPEKPADLPKIEGLQATLEMKQIIYRAEKGNPYGLKEGELAGIVEAIKTIRKTKLAEVDKVVSTEEMGVILDPKVLVYHLLKNNRPEQLASGLWKTVFWFDPIGSTPEVVEMEVVGARPGPYTQLCVRAVEESKLREMRILSICPDKATVKSYPKVEFYPSIHLFYPENLVPEKGINWGPTIYYSTGNPLVDNMGKIVNFGSPLVDGISGQIAHPSIPVGTQLLFLISGLQGAKRVDLGNFLSFDGKLAFMFDKTLRDKLAIS